MDQKTTSEMMIYLYSQQQEFVDRSDQTWTPAQTAESALAVVESTAAGSGVLVVVALP
jgi:hypothetical protein